MVRADGPAALLVIAGGLPLTRRRRPDEPPEVARQLRLIIEANLGAGTRYPAAHIEPSLDSEKR